VDAAQSITLRNNCLPMGRACAYVAMSQQCGNPEAFAHETGIFARPVLMIMMSSHPEDRPAAA
jgi:hypothetical protein